MYQFYIHISCNSSTSGNSSLRWDPGCGQRVKAVAINQQRDQLAEALEGISLASRRNEETHMAILI